MEAIELRRDQALRDELRARIAACLPSDGTVEALSGLHLYRLASPSDRICGISRLSLCVIAQGAKEVTLGSRAYSYDADRYLLATAELPISSRILKASPAEPYLSLQILIDPAMVTSVMVEAGLMPPTQGSDARALCVSELESGLLESVVRLVRLAESPGDQPIMRPMIQREIVYRLLRGDQAGRLHHAPNRVSHTNRIGKAIQKLREEFDRPLRIDGIARELGMSTSAFHQHFKAVTDMSPLQFQKQIRLQEARRLMIGEHLDASSAGFRVGYEDASHFSRDYKRLFGESPARDAERLRNRILVG